MAFIPNTVASIADQAELAAGVYFAVTAHPGDKEKSFIPNSYLAFAQEYKHLRQRLIAVDQILLRARATEDDFFVLADSDPKVYNRLNRQGVKMALNELNHLQGCARVFYTNSLMLNVGGLKSEPEFEQSKYREACESYAWAVFCLVSEAIDKIEDEFKDVLTKD